MTINDENSKPTVTVGDFPVGTIIPFAGLLNAHAFETAGWLYCNGNTVSRTTYADLFAVIGIAHGQGDGISTFNLPDYRGTFLRGVNGTASPARDPNASERTAANTGGNTGNNVGSVQSYATGEPALDMTTNTIGDHTHTVPNVPTDKSSYSVAGNYQAIWNSETGEDAPKVTCAGEHAHNVNGGGDAETRPPNAYVYYLIRFQS